MGSARKINWGGVKTGHPCLDIRKKNVHNGMDMFNILLHLSVSNQTCVSQTWPLNAQQNVPKFKFGNERDSFCDKFLNVALFLLLSLSQLDG